MIDVNAFWRFVKAQRAAKEKGDGPTQKRSKQQYAQRVGLCELIHQAFRMDAGLTLTQKLKAARLLSAPEVELQPQRWAEQFEAMAETEAVEPLKQLFAIAGDLCATVNADLEIVDGEEFDQDAADEGTTLAYLGEKGAA